ncbi:MAG: tetratricopeptide repeat protein, partial [Terriglobia bacterium]
MKRTQTFTLAALVLLAISATRAAISRPAGPERQNSAVAEHFHAGQKALREGNFAEAVREFHQVLRLDPGLPEAEINLGLAYHLQGDYKLASEEIEKGLEQTPGVVGANIVLGIDQLRLGFAGRAITPLKRALRADPSNKQALRTLAEAFVAQGDYLEASRTYRTLFHDENSGANRWLGLGEAYLRMSSRLTTLMARNDNDTVWAYRLAGDLLSVRGNWNDAARKYRLALARDFSQPGLHASLGDTLLEDGKLQEAEVEYQNELKSDPSSPHALLGLAQIELERNRGDEALRHVSKVAAISLPFLAAQADFPKVNLSPALAAELAGGLVNEKSQPGAHFLLAALYRIAGESAQANQERVQFQLKASRSAN